MAQLDPPQAGAIYGFETRPLWPISPPRTGRFGAFKVLGVNAELIALCVLDGVWPAVPTLQDVQRTSILRERAFGQKGHLSVFGMATNWWTLADLDGAVLLGEDACSDAEKALARDVMSHASGIGYSTLGNLTSSVELEWRWANDQVAMLTEHEQINAKRQADRAAADARYRNRLKGLTWETLLAEPLLSRWSPSPPFPNGAFTQAARDRLRQCQRDLAALGPKPGKPKVRSALKACVTWFNAADDAAGGVIETEERDDLWTALEEMAFVARQRGLIEEIDEWRTW